MARATRDGDARRAPAGGAGARVGPDQPRRRRRAAAARGGRRSRRAWRRARRAPTPGTKRQLNNWLYARMDEQLELEAQIQQEMAGSEDFLEGALAFVREAPGALLGQRSADSWQTSSSASRPGLNRIPAALGHLAPLNARVLHPAVGRLAQREPDQQPLQDHAVHRAGDLRRWSRAALALRAGQVPRAQGRGAPRRSAATRAWRSAGRSARR